MITATSTTIPTTFRAGEIFFLGEPVFSVPVEPGSDMAIPLRCVRRRDVAATRTTGLSETIRLNEEHPSIFPRQTLNPGLDSSADAYGSSVKQFRGPGATTDRKESGGRAPGRGIRSSLSGRVCPSIFVNIQGVDHPENPAPGVSQSIMPQTSRFAVILVGLIITHPLCGPAVASEDFAFYHENVLGTSLELCVRAESPEAARGAEHRVLAEIDRLAAIFSGYDQTSEFSRWQAAPRNPLRVSPELYDVLLASEYWGHRSGGAFDPRVEVLSRLWARCSQLGRLPTHEETTAAKALLMTPAWRTGPAAYTVERLSDCPLSLNGIAKGYIVEKACDGGAGKVRRGQRDSLERRRGPAGARRGRSHDRRRRPVGRLRVIGTLRLYRSERPLGRHQRQIPARVPDQRQVVLSCFRPEDRRGRSSV